MRTIVRFCFAKRDATLDAALERLESAAAKGRASRPLDPRCSLLGLRALRRLLGGGCFAVRVSAPAPPKIVRLRARLANARPRRAGGVRGAERRSGWLTTPTRARVELRREPARVPTSALVLSASALARDIARRRPGEMLDKTRLKNAICVCSAAPAQLAAQRHPAGAASPCRRLLRDLPESTTLRRPSVPAAVRRPRCDASSTPGRSARDGRSLLGPAR